MFVQAILLVLTILIPGYYLRNEFSVFRNEKISPLYVFIESLVIGTSVLIIPMLVIGVLVRDSLDQVVYLFFFLNGFTIIAYLVQLLSKIKNIESSWSSTNFRESLRKIELRRESTHVYDIQRALIYVIFGIVGSITLANFIMPPRGWDALHFYFPNARYFYNSDEIPFAVNYLNFLPPFKPPLNVLLYTYDNYLTSDFDSQLFPIVFIIGILSVTYLFGKELGFGDKFSLLVILHILTLPAFFMTFREYIYYQELPVTFYYSATILFFYKGSNLLRKPVGLDRKKGRYYIILGSISASLAIASKISGFTILPAIFIFFPVVKSKKINLLIKIPLTVAFVSFLIIKGIASTYIWTVVVVAFFGLLLIYLVASDKQFSQITTIKYTWGLVIPLMSAALWIWQITRVKGAGDFLYNLYFSISSLNVQWKYAGIQHITQVYVENAHASSWFMSVFTIFFASQMNGFLGFFRIFSIVNTVRHRKESKLGMMLTWLVFFYIMWLTYFSTVSVRYLSIIWIPLSFLTIDGMLRTFDFFIKSSNRKFYTVLLNDSKYDILPKHIFVGFFVPLASSSLLYWPFIPFQYATKFFNIPSYEYHHNVIQTMVYLVIFNALFIYFAVFVNDPIKIQNILKVDLKKVKVPRRQVILTNLLIGFSLTGIMGPYMLDGGLFAISGFDRTKYADNFIYDNRLAVRELFSAVEKMNYPSSDITMGLNLPGFEYYLNRPFLELQELDGLLEFDAGSNSIFYSNDTQKVISEFINKDIRLLVAMKPAHYFYETYNLMKEKYPFLSIIENNGELVYENSEFMLFRVV